MKKILVTALLFISLIGNSQILIRDTIDRKINLSIDDKVMGQITTGTIVTFVGACIMVGSYERFTKKNFGFAFGVGMTLSGVAIIYAAPLRLLTKHRRK